MKRTGMQCNSKKLIEIKSGVIELRIYPYDTWYAHGINNGVVIVEKNTARILISNKEFNEKFTLRGD